MDACKGADDDGLAAEVSRRHGGVLAARPFTVVLVTDGDPADPVSLVVAGNLGVRHVPLAADDVEALSRLARVGVHGAEEGVVADVVEVAAEAQPRACGRNVVGGALSGRLQEYGQALEIGPVPSRKGLEHLQAAGLGINLHFHAGAVFSGGLVAVAAPRVAARGRFWRLARRFELPRIAVAGQRVGQRIERQTTGQGVGHHDFGAGDEVHRRGVGVIARREVAVERCDDGVLLALLDGGPPPLANARPARVGEHRRADLLEVGHLAVALNGGVDRFRAGGDEQVCLHPHAVRLGLLGDGGDAGDVLVGGVGAGSDERGRHAVGVALRRHRGGYLGDGARQIGRVRPDDVRLQRR